MRHVDLSGVSWEKLDRGARESLIKGFLRENDLTPPASLGNLEEGTPEIVGLPSVYWNNNFFADIEFDVRWKAGGNPLPFVMRSNKGGAGAVFVPIVEGKIALVRQWRPCLGRHTWEIPRGFSQEWASQKKLTPSAIPKGFQTVLAELSEEVGQAADISSHFLGEVAENSGTTTTSPAYWILNIGKIQLGGTEGISVKLVSADDVWKALGTEINDNHSIVALTLAKRHMGW